MRPLVSASRTASSSNAFVNRFCCTIGAPSPHRKPSTFPGQVQSSYGTFGPSLGFSFYCAAKLAVEGFSETLAEEVKHLGIHVTIVEPGGFRSDFAGPSLDTRLSAIDDYRPAGTASASIPRNGTATSLTTPPSSAWPCAGWWMRISPRYGCRLVPTPCSGAGGSWRRFPMRWASGSVFLFRRKLTVEV